MERRMILVLTLLTLAALSIINATGCQPSPSPGGKAGAFTTSATADKPKEVGTSQRSDCSLPYPESFVSDFANVIDDEMRGKLERKLEKLKRSGKIDFAVVTIKTTGEQPIFDYSLALAQCWSIGASNPDKAGILLLVAVDDRKWQIQISRKLEEELSNGELSEWGGLMKEPFREGRYGEGLIKYADVIITALEKRRGFSVRGA